MSWYRKQAGFAIAGAMVSFAVLIMLSLSGIVIANKYLQTSQDTRTQAACGDIYTPCTTHQCFPHSCSSLTPPRASASDCGACPFSNWVCCGDEITIVDRCPQGNSFCSDNGTFNYCKPDRSGYVNQACGPGTTCPQGKTACETVAPLADGTVCLSDPQCRSGHCVTDSDGVRRCGTPAPVNPPPVDSPPYDNGHACTGDIACKSGYCGRDPADNTRACATRPAAPPPTATCSGKCISAMTYANGNYVTVSGTCANSYICVKDGEPLLPAGAACTTSPQCVIGLLCIQGKCASASTLVSGLNGPCNHDGFTCKSPYTCINNTCQVPPTLRPSPSPTILPCSGKCISAMTYANGNYVTVSGTCSGNYVCVRDGDHLLPAGAACTTSSQCVTGLMCIQGKCASASTLISGLNGPCNHDGFTCKPEFNCIDRICRLPPAPPQSTITYTRKEGETCNSTTGCLSGLTCIYGYCASNERLTTPVTSLADLTPEHYAMTCDPTKPECQDARQNQIDHAVLTIDQQGLQACYDNPDSQACRSYQDAQKVVAIGGLAAIAAAPVIAPLIGTTVSAASLGGTAGTLGTIANLPTAAFATAQAAVTTLPAWASTTLAVTGTGLGWAGVAGGTYACVDNPNSEACMAYVAGLQADPTALIDLAAGTGKVFTGVGQSIDNYLSKQIDNSLPDNVTFGPEVKQSLQSQLDTIAQSHGVSRYNPDDSYEKFVQYITGHSPSLEPEIIAQQMIDDHYVIKAKYGLPSRMYEVDNVSQSIDELKAIAQKEQIEIRNAVEYSEFFRDNPMAGAVAFQENGSQIVIPSVDNNNVDRLWKYRGDLEHELIHGLQNKYYPSMPIELQEYEAYVGSNMSLQYMQNKPVEGVDAIFGYGINGSVNYWYKDQGILPIWD